MRETTPTPEFSTLAGDEALEYAREAEQITAELADLYDRAPERRDLIGRANTRLGVVLKLGVVHSNLAVAEQVLGLRADLANVPVPSVTDPHPTGPGSRVVHLANGTKDAPCRVPWCDETGRHEAHHSSDYVR